MDGSSVVCVSVCLSVCHDCEPCKNDRTDRDAAWDVDTEALLGGRAHGCHLVNMIVPSVWQRYSLMSNYFDHLLLLLLPHHHHHTTTILWPFFRDHLGEPVPEENIWTLWCKGRLTEADTPTIRLGATPSGLSSAHLQQPPIFYRPDALPVTQPTVSNHCYCYY